MRRRARPAAGICHASLYRFDQPEESYWEASGGPRPVGCDPLGRDVACEVAIVGGGYTGLSAALHLTRDHGLSAVVLEAGHIGWGASGRNGGFVCLGGLKLGYAQVLNAFGRKALRTLFDQQKGAIALVAELADIYRIDMKRSGDGEYVLAHNRTARRQLAREAAWVVEHLGERWQMLAREEVEETVCRANGMYGALFVPHGFGIHPLRYVRGLARAAIEEGARIHQHSRVAAWQRCDDGFLLSTPGGTVRARRLIIATNGFYEEGLHPKLDGTLLPALSSIIVTRPLSPAEREAQGWTKPALVADSRTLLFYTRLLPDGRFLFGSRGGVSSTPDAAARQVEWMKGRLGERFPAWKDVGIDHAWRGLVCLARDRTAHLAALDDDGRIVTALGYHGNGVAMGTFLGQAAADLVATGTTRRPIAGFMRCPPPRFALPAFRLPMLRAAYLAHGMRDEWLP